MSTPTDMKVLLDPYTYSTNTVGATPTALNLLTFSGINLNAIMQESTPLGQNMHQMSDTGRRSIGTISGTYEVEFDATGNRTGTYVTIGAVPIDKVPPPRTLKGVWKETPEQSIAIEVQVTKNDVDAVGDKVYVGTFEAELRSGVVTRVGV